MNFLWIDVETTGLYADKHDVVQLACIPVINGVRQKPFNEFCQPKNWDAIDDGAVRVHGITRERMKTFQTPEQLVEKLVVYLRSFGVKFIIAGYNVNFDRQFASALFTKCGRPRDFFSLFELHIHDTYARVKSVKTQIKTENHKLETLAKHYGFHIDAHDALSDISATIDVDQEVGKLLGEDQEVVTRSSVTIDESIKFPEPAQLHLHSSYGMVESVPNPKEWLKWCEENNVPGFSIVDHGTAISMFDMVNMKSDKVITVPGVGLHFSVDNVLYPFNAWAVSQEGYFNLMKLASVGYDNQVTDDGVIRPVVTHDDIENYRDGIKFGTGDVYGAIGGYLAEGDVHAAELAFDEYRRLFGENLYVEFCPVRITETYSAKMGFQRIKKNEVVADGDLNKSYNRFMFSRARVHELACIPVSGAHFIDKADKLIQDVIAKNSYDSGKYYIESYHARTATEIYWGLKDHLGDDLTEEMFNQWIENTYEILEGAKNIKIEHDYHMPKIDIPDHIKEKTSDYDEQTLHYTLELCKQHGRWRDEPEYIARLKKEIAVIMKNGTLNFLPYFLLYEDICTYARAHGIMQNIGRGSAGGCLLSYYLKIIHIDPIETDLPFERFLSVARINAGSFPDIDCDFGDRTPIIRYLEEKYGAGFAQICTFQKMKTKNAIKDAMWALYGKNRKDPNVEAVCSLIPDSPQGVDEYDFLYGYTNKEGEYTPGIVETVPDVAAFFEQFSQVEKMVKRLIGLMRGWGRHASAYVISTVDLSSERVPTMKMFDKHSNEMITVTQYEASMVEDCGLVKADILGVTTIQAVSDCIDLILENTGKNYLEEDDRGTSLVYRLPEDERVYTDFFNKKTDSSFQFNTSLIKGYIQQFCPTQREHLSAMTALCRPGALDAPFTNDEISLDDGVTAAQYYMDVRNGKRKLSYLHPDLASCTSNGIFVYQEEVMKFLVEIAGYTLEESDRIRGAIAKKKHDVMMSTFDRIRKATAARGWTPEQSQTVCDAIQAFARYSFNRSHSRCYGELGYITMYLKHHHKLEWWTAVLNNTGSEDKLRHYMTLLGDMVQSPSIDKPSRKFQIRGNKIVAPLSVLKRVGGSCIDELVDKGPFTDLDDYIERVRHNKVNIGHFSSIIKGRAADCFMDPDLPYADARIKLMNDYQSKRKCKPFKDELMDVSPMSVFLMEKETNKCFNKTVLNDPALVDLITKINPDFVPTGRKGVPMTFKRTPILANIKVAQGLLENGHDSNVGMIMLFEGSSAKSGNSKKTGKPYCMVKATLSDGYSTVECTWWDKKKAFGWPHNCLVFVRGKLKEGWKTPVSIVVHDMERIT